MTGRLFLTRAEALERGITQGRLRGPAYRRLFTNLYVPSSVEVTPLVLASAALTLAPPRAVVARHTAAALLGGVVPASHATHLTLPTGRLRVSGIDARRGTVRTSARMHGLPVTSAEDTFVAMAGELGLVDLVVLGDSLVAAGRASPRSLVVAAHSAVGRVARPARRAARLVRAGVDSPMETRLRLLIVLAGLPEPVVNHVVLDARGRWVRRFDLAYPELKVAVEYDGRQHVEDRAQWESDVARREELDDGGWRLVVVLSRGVYVQPERTLARIVAVLRSRGVRCAVVDDTWRLHFPGRG